jgi:hypothetical protein
MIDDLKIIDKGEYLYFDFFGQFSVMKGKSVIDAMVKYAIEYSQTKILLDCRKITGEMPVMERYQVAEYSEVTRKNIDKIAMVNRDDVVLPDNFVENVAVNRGINLKIFKDIYRFQ